MKLNKYKAPSCKMCGELLVPYSEYASIWECPEHGDQYVNMRWEEDGEGDDGK